jgi:hypothetical protein
MCDSVRVSVIASGFDKRGARPAAAFAGFSTERERGTSAAAALETTMPELEVPGDALEIPSFLREE